MKGGDRHGGGREGGAENEWEHRERERERVTNECKKGIQNKEGGKQIQRQEAEGVIAEYCELNEL